MFGYVRPYVGELKVKEFEQFKACYCALCHTLGKKYGIASRFILNYDFTFLAMLLWGANEPLQIEKKRCIACPYKKKSVCSNSRALEISAGHSVILAYWKLKDSVADDGFWRSLIARLGLVALHGSYKKAAVNFPEYSKNVEIKMKELSMLENSGEQSIDRTADKFAQILSSPEYSKDEARQRTLSVLLYHLGRWIYIMDAVNDFESDIKKNAYNPVASHYAIKSSEIDENIKDELKITVSHSQNIICSSFELLHENHWTGIIRNIIYSGMSDVSFRVFNGTFLNKREGLPR